MTNAEYQDELLHVGKPMKRLKLTFEPVSPLDGPIVDGPLIPVGRPMRRTNQIFDTVDSVFMELILKESSSPE
jgi:hypothetical protein